MTVNSLLKLFCTYLLIEITIYLVLFVFLINQKKFNSFIEYFNLLLFFSGQLLLIIVGWYVIHFLYHFHHRNDQLETKDKAVLITGCDSGLGLATAKQLNYLGFNVFATVLDADSEGAQQLRKECSKRIKIIKMDLRIDSEIKNAVDCVKNSGHMLWALVNNAGVCMMSFTEFDSNSNTCQETFDVNFFGPYKLTKLCLPMLRKSKGRVVNITSVSAESSVGLTTIYSASKHALRALSNGLRAELALFGVKVICVEPGGFRTNIIDNSHIVFDHCLEQADSLVLNDYEQVYRGLRNGFDNKTGRKFRSIAASEDFSELTSAVEKALLNRNPKMCYRVTGRLMRPFWWLMTLVPDEIICWLNLVYFKTFFENDFRE